MLVWFLLIAPQSAVWAYYGHDTLAGALLALAALPAAMKWVFRL
jgi:hypothetical protein